MTVYRKIIQYMNIFSVLALSDTGIYICNKNQGLLADNAAT